MQNRCAAASCGACYDAPLFRFPRDPQRCKKWVENSRCEDLQEKSLDHLYRYCRLCVKHFDAASIEKNDSLNTTLKDDAIPTIFDVSGQSENGQLKRKKPADKNDETEKNAKKKTAKSEKDKESDTPTVSEEDEYKDYLKSLFEVLVLLGVQNIHLKGPAADKQESLASSNFQALLDYRMNAGDEALKKRYDAQPENKECCSSSQLSQLVEVCEKCIRDELLKEVRQNVLFSLVTDDLVKISEEWHLPVFLRYVDQTNCQQEKLAGLLPFEGDGEALAERLLAELTDKWGLNMEHCRGQAHSCSGSHFRKIKAFASKLSQKYPMATLTPSSVCALTISLANSMAVSGVQLVMSTFRKITSFFSQSLSLQLELEHAISIFYSDKEDKANELKEVSRTSWTTRHDAFEVAVVLIESLLLCVDSVHDNEEMQWGDKITHYALQISKMLADFEFVMSLVVLKNTLSLTRAFGKNVQGEAADAYFAADSLKAVLHSLTEVSDNIDVYHEFWYEEAVNLAASLEIQVKVPWSVLKHRSGSRTMVQPESYYKQHLTVPVVDHVVKEMKELFCENHLKALRCLSLVPTVLEQNKSAEPEMENIQMYKNDIPNAGTLPAELHCWWVKWSHRSKGDVVPCTLHETLQLADVKFFPNMLAVLKVIGTLPTFVLENKSDVSYRRFKMYMENTPDNCRSKSLALLNVNSDARYDLDAMVEAYVTAYPEKDA
ncbi:THAP domain containing 12a [Lampris incognitus]|uniref:THAP domain containing 12a n=1 Tax=Lampris incognitus TaxID=2546036 RepID=UPI0024B61454|nr:THAP domain containing 12a [Lampris incognitus]